MAEIKESVKDRIIWDISNLFKHEDDYYKLVRVRKFWIYHYI